MISARDLNFGHVILIGIIFFSLFGILVFLIDYKAPVSLKNERDNAEIMSLLENEFDETDQLMGIELSRYVYYSEELMTGINNSERGRELIDRGVYTLHYRTFLVRGIAKDSLGHQTVWESCFEKRFTFLKERPKSLIAIVKK